MERFSDLGVNMLFEYIDEEQKNWINFIEEEDRGDQMEEIRKKTKSGRPIGPTGFIEKIEKKLGKSLRMKPKGRPRK